MSRLYLKTGFQNQRTVIEEVFFTSPLKIAKPFYHNNYTQVMMMCASAGMLDGDIYDISLDIMPDTSLVFTQQSYTKIFKANKKGAEQNIRINVSDSAKLIFFSQPTIPFSGSIYNNFTEINLGRSSKFIMCDIISSGRLAMNEKLEFNIYRSRTAVYVENKLMFLDNQKLLADEMNLEGAGFFENYTHSGMIYAYGYDDLKIPEKNNICSAVTKAKAGICVRLFSNSSDEMVKFIETIIKQS